MKRGAECVSDSARGGGVHVGSYLARADESGNRNEQRLHVIVGRPKLILQTGRRRRRH